MSDNLVLHGTSGGFASFRSVEMGIPEVLADSELCFAVSSRKAGARWRRMAPR